MSIPGAASPLFIGAAAEEAAFQIDRSLRFNSGDTSYLNRTPSSASNRRTWTWSAWVKRSGIGANDDIFKVSGSATKATQFRIQIHNGNYVSIDYGAAFYLKTNRLLRDPSAWMHLVVAVDTTTSTADNRIRLYINGSEETSFDTRNNPNQDEELAINTASAHTLSTADSNGLDGYLAEVHFVDGTALAPTDFGEYDDNNNWNPKEYSGSYGTNGFHLDFSNTSDLGADAAGSNDWTPNNLFGTAPGLATANQGFDVVTYTGNGSTQSITGLNFQPDFVWLKSINNNYDHELYDSVRGATKRIYANATDAEATFSDGLTSFDSSGFSVGSRTNVNGSSSNMVAWCWKAGGTASSNSDGSITSSASVNSTYGFSIVTYTGTGSNATVGHGLSSTPKWILVKRRDSAGSFIVWHDAFGAASNTDYLYLNSQIAIGGDGSNAFWNSTVPTSSVFSVGTGASVNASSGTYVAYCWSEISGFSKFGSYTGNGSSTGPIVTTGFKPRYILIKADIAGEDWVILDTARDSGNPVDQIFFANTADAEITNSAYNTEFQVDGFQLKNTNPRFNTSGETYIYAAFASKPDQSVIDSLIDTPTNYTAGSGNNGGNYPTLNPLKKASITTSNGNLDFAHSGSTGFWQVVFSTMGMTSGKYYCEFTCADADSIIGIAKDSHTLANDKYLGQDPNGWSYNGQNGQKINNSSSSSYGDTFTSGDIIGIAFDATGGNLYFYKNGTAQNSGTAAFTGLTDGPYLFAFSIRDTGSTHNVNFGQRPFSQSVPTGYTSLVSTNLPDPTIADGSTVFDVRSGLTAQFTISDLNFAADLVVAKSTSHSEYWIVADVVRSFIGGLRWNDTDAEGSGAAITSVGATGYQSSSNWFTTGRTYATFNWDAGTSTATNNDGSIAASVRVNQSAGFSIATWTGQSSGSATVGHGLNAAPEWIIVKARTGSVGWTVGHQSIGWTKRVQLNTNAAPSTSSNYWNDTAPTNSVFTSGANNVSNTFVAYCWAPVSGYSSFGQYIGNGASDGTFVYTGFRVAWLMIKRTDTSENWEVRDSTRNPHNRTNLTLFPHVTGAEDSGSVDFDLLSNGFKLRNTNGSTNASGGTYIYMAFAENPFKTARAR